MRGVALLVVVLCGCHELFGLDRIQHADASVDSSVDAPPTCPSNYDLPLHPGSRYRVNIGGNPIAHYNACAADASGLTHLAVLNSMEEQAVLQNLVDARTGLYFVGAVQRADSMTTGGGWIWITGELVIGTQWGAFEPNDVDGLETDHWEQFALLFSGRTGLIDYSETEVFDAICECDGRQVTAEAQALIELYTSD